MIWKKEDIDFLNINYPLYGSEYCCIKLNKTNRQIITKCSLLKIKLNKDVKSKKFSNIKKNSKNSVPYETFININSKEISYILGFLWTDGHVRKPYTISTTINIKDSSDIKNIFDKTGNWSFYSYKKYDKRTTKKYDSFTITTSNKNIVNFLIENDYNEKSKLSPDKILSKIPSEYKSYFFRGYSDGDGCFYKYKNNHQYIITSTYEQDWSFMKIILNELKIIFNIKKSNNTNKEGKISKYSQILITNKNDIDIFGDYIYKDNIEFDNVGLYRKYEKYLDIKNTKIKKLNYWTDNDIELLTQNYNNYTNKEISEILHKTKYSVDAKSSRLKLKTNLKI